MKLARPLRRYSVGALPYTCSMFEIGNFSDAHAHRQVQYTNDTFLPPSPTGLYCATFVKDDEASDAACAIIEDTFKRITRTQWKPNKSNTGFVRFCLYKLKETE